MAWLLQREMKLPSKTRKVSLNNMGFVSPGGERWTILGNARGFWTMCRDTSAPYPSLHIVARKQALVVRLAAMRSDVLIAPCSEMANRIASAAPGISDKVVVRMHPVSANFVSRNCTEPLLLCPVVFEKYKYMAERLKEWVGHG